MRIDTLLQRGSILAVLTVLPLLIATRDASAQDCQADSDCGSGYRCATSTGVSCNYCPGEADGGFPLGLPDGSFEFPLDTKNCDAGCAPYEYNYCTHASCNSSSDCPSDMACHSDTWSECTEACTPGVSCAPDSGFACSEHTESTCNERYNLPCESDAECGEGFDCNLDPYTVCSGGGGVVFEPDGGISFVDAGSNCTVETPTFGYCNLLALPCETNRECPTGLSCQDSFTYPPCTAVPGDPGVLRDAGLAFENDAGIFVNWNCPAPVVSKVCRPERWASDGGGGFGGLFGGGLFGGGGAVAGGSIGGGITGGGGGFIGGSGFPDGGSALTDASIGLPPASGGTTAGTSAGGGFGGSTGGTGANSDAGVPDDDDENDENDEGAGRPHKHGLRSLLRGLLGAGGCSVSGQPAEGNLAWFALLGGMLALRTRRRR